MRDSLLNYSILEAKLRDTNITTVLDDYTVWLADNPNDEPVRLIYSALQMSVNILKKDKSALAHQLAGRLMRYYKTIPDIRIFLDVVVQTPNNLFPLTSEYDILKPAGSTSEYSDKSIEIIGLRDGRILSWGKDGILRLWTIDGTLLTTLLGHTDFINGAIELHDGRILSWSRDKTLQLFDNTTKYIATLIGHTDSVFDAKELADGRILSCSLDNTLRLWDSMGNPLALLTGHTDLIDDAKELADGRILSWSNWDGTWRLWSRDGESVLIIHEPINPSIPNVDSPFGIMELPHGRLLTWGKDNTLRLWDNTWQLLKILNGHQYWVWDVFKVSDNRFLSWSGHVFGSGRDYSEICLWNTEGLLIDVIEQNYHVGDRDIILAWAKKNGLKPTDIYPPKHIPTLITGEFVQKNGSNLIVSDAQTKSVIHTFYADSFLTSLSVDSGGYTVVAGDVSGRVLFLRWVGDG